MTAVTDLEVWMVGTRAERDAAVSALASVGRVAYQGARQTLPTDEAGRHRLYLRLYITARAATRPAGGRASAGPAGGELIDLDTARAARRPA